MSKRGRRWLVLTGMVDWINGVDGRGPKTIDASWPSK
jgi:hypothetical protein